MAPTGAKKSEEKGTAEVIADLWQLVKDYAKQETVDPLKSIGRFLAYGVPGALLLGLGVLFAALAILRGLQTETGPHLTGSWNWVPYAVALVVSAVVIALAVKAISKPSKSAKARS
ncbi:hypothetical protein KSP35_04345 [Aquihabitans sp. G128]|uniref:hypothetical protein n=1 Tax=Aquihabitans sp. G128 TaxID=2849779 RepID=UPI001C247466|nr:hypothetical protein [Aquihabitans sp. G128]QXC62049.1 hypothetical protein KSP35_04345 [Aquihabitans sp. G128]